MTDVSARTAELRVLGPMECTTARPISLGGPKQRLVLALLLAHADEVVTARTLLDTLWGEQAPEDARHTLQVFVSRLRGALHAVGGTLAWQESGYVLTAPPERVDAHRFERLVREAARPDGPVVDPARQRVLLGEALSLWRGRPFGELGDHPALMAECERLTELRLRATEARIDLDLADGRHEALLPELRALTGEHPLAESLCLRFLLALHRCGRRPEALATYDRMRRTLSQELGVDPSRALQQTHLLLLDDDPRLDTLAPGHLEGVDAGPKASTRDRRTPSVAVLPFEVLGGDQAELLAAGLHAELLVELAKVERLTVVGRFSVLGYAGTVSPLPRIAAELGVGTVVTGSVRVSGDRLALAVELVDVADGRHRWAESYDVALAAPDLLGVQCELARDLSAALSRRLVADLPSTTSSLEVYRLVAEGRLHFDRKTEDDFARATELFRRAIDLDPDYLPAWLGLAEALALTADYAYGDRERLLTEAESAVERCLALRPTAPEADVARGLIAEARFHAPAARAAYARVLRHVPGHADAHSWTAWMALTVGRPREALPAARRAVQLNPLSAEAVSNLALALLAGGDPAAAHAEAQRAVALSPGFTTARYYAGLALYDLGRFEDAVETLAPLATTTSGTLSTAWAGHGPDTALALSHVATGDAPAARTVLAAIDPREHPVEAGLVHLALGEAREAAEVLDRPVSPGYGPAMLFHLHFRDVWEQLDGDRRGRLEDRIRRSWNDVVSAR
ncbi:BTAD domain-containing putative transcriptional regulator [Ornithinimicrobium sp. W1679]|uniref:BTAD domain-containing putative transcriptional regulator n=1 Tax=Ornithinimicrobium sp. W1679 TaxID=3418770 RepID=UPI003CE7E2AC